MKKSTILIAFLGLSFFSCEKQHVEEPVAEQVENQATMEEPTEIVNGVIRQSMIEWTGYKTNEKIGVSGKFDVVQVKNVQEGNTPEQVLEGAEIYAMINTLNSDNQARDQKLKDILFGTMRQTGQVKGVLKFRDNKTFLTLTMNKESKEYEVKSTFEKNIFTIEADVDLLDFNANTAVEALNAACLELHKGADGVSKTWSEVHIKGQIEFSEMFGK